MRGVNATRVIQMGSVIFCAAHDKNAVRAKTQRFEDLLTREKTLGFDSTKWSEEFNAYVDKNRERGKKFAQQVRASGDKVAAYGGARPVVTTRRRASPA